jgi:hypothetical protein
VFFSASSIFFCIHGRYSLIIKSSGKRTVHDNNDQAESERAYPLSKHLKTCLKYKKGRAIMHGNALPNTD